MGRERDGGVQSNLQECERKRCVCEREREMEIGGSGAPIQFHFHQKQPKHLGLNKGPITARFQKSVCTACPCSHSASQSSTLKVYLLCALGYTQRQTDKQTNRQTDRNQCSGQSLHNSCCDISKSILYYRTLSLNHRKSIWSHLIYSVIILYRRDI